MEAILKIAKEDELPESCIRRTLGRARDEMVNEHTVYGHLHEIMLIDGTAVEVSNPFALLWYAANKCSGFAALLDRAAQHKQPWHIALYADGVAWQPSGAQNGQENMVLVLDNYRIWSSSIV